MANPPAEPLHALIWPVSFWFKINKSYISFIVSYCNHQLPFEPWLNLYISTLWCNSTLPRIKVLLEFYRRANTHNKQFCLKTWARCCLIFGTTFPFSSDRWIRFLGWTGVCYVFSELFLSPMHTILAEKNEYKK